MDEFLNYAAKLQGPHNFWAKIRIGSSGECWPWTAAITSAGYGSFGYQGKRANASRLAYLFTKGEIPAGLEVMHSCDNPRCCNPAHLSVGTRSQNMQDCVSRNRAARKGNPAKFSKAAELQIAADYASGIPVMDIAERYGCHKTMPALFAKKYGVPPRMRFFPKKKNQPDFTGEVSSS